jgi:PhzF family phenazine biosynthesis protein
MTKEMTMSTPRRFKQVDVFTQVPFLGNPLAVVLDGDGLDPVAMHAIARWTNLSETTFVCQPSDPAADYRLRIFSPWGEFPFAGHPTLGSAHALLEAGLVPKTAGRLVQQCGVGLVALTIGTDGMLAFEAPPARCTPMDAALAPLLQAALRLPHQARATRVDLGIRWLIVPLDSAADCLAVQADGARLEELIRACDIDGVAMYGAHEGDGRPADIEVRALLVENGLLVEDPVTGSANACIARLRQERGDVAEYRARQGTQLKRDGRIAVTHAGGAPWIGGHSVTVVDGLINI